MGGEASEALPSGGSANGVVAFWSDKRFMRVAQDHRRDFRPIVEQSLWVAGTFVRVPDDREGGRGILGSPTMVSPTVVIASQPEREVCLDDDERV